LKQVLSFFSQHIERLINEVNIKLFNEAKWLLFLDW